MISHAHRCVFVHIPKCGGQSVERIFIEDCGLTWESRAPLILRPNDNPDAGPPRLAHLTYRDYLRYGYADEALMREYFVFSVVRNPYARVLSLYRYLRYDSSMSFAEFVIDVLCWQVKNKGDMCWFMSPQFEYVCDAKGFVGIDQWVRLEEIDEKLPPLLQKVGVSVSEIPRANKTRVRRMAAEGVADIAEDDGWNPDLKARVFSVYEPDFFHFGYAR
ncbi:sulfotransferase family 2 domain-containing protein [Pseudomonas sp. CC6-YY-74]|uniref:sulfotransferase family 2 domain-containing protein n=1 Tax=Pseudomonas sp. CC6-YY-74 TaxID=1930532 RepID=UPI0009A1FD76|nr:sulfotransferase family 2 domain-containing protein [Pseudomonas sp. CC6-YY-74]